MRITITDSSAAMKTEISTMARRIKGFLDAAPYGTLYTTSAIGEKLNLKRSSVDNHLVDLPGYSMLRLVNGHWRRLLGSPRTVTELAKESKP